MLVALVGLELGLIVAAIRRGWWSRGQLIRIGKHALRFTGVFFGVLLVLSIAIPLTDNALYVRGVVLPENVMVYLAPTLMITVAAAVGVFAVWKADRKAVS